MYFTVCLPALLQIAVMISVGFLGCWAPYGMVSLWSVLRDSSTIPPEVSLLPCMFAKSSTVYNPLIYYVFSKSFKKEVNGLFLQYLGISSCVINNNINDNSICMVTTKRQPEVAAAQTFRETVTAHVM